MMPTTRLCVLKNLNPKLKLMLLALYYHINK
jgi:hypothetical protein